MWSIARQRREFENELQDNELSYMFLVQQLPALLTAMIVPARFRFRSVTGGPDTSKKDGEEATERSAIVLIDDTAHCSYVTFHVRRSDPSRVINH